MKNNKAKFDTNDLAVLFGEDSVKNIESSRIFNGVSIDSRTIEQGNIFVAIQGESVDGHSKIDHAFQNGASLAIAVMDKYQNTSDKPVLFVKDTTEALGKLANHHRRRFRIPVVAIAGSNGKTTTKEITAHLLAQRYNVLKTHKNYNNQFGTPLMLLQLNDEHDIAVLEIGTNQPGEITILSEMVEPTHGLVTNIGREHLEQLESLDGVEMEETSLFSFLIRNNGLIFLNMDDIRLSKYTRIINKLFSYGNNNEFNLYAKASVNDELFPEITMKYNGRDLNVKMNEPCMTMGLNAIAASALAFHFGLEVDEIKKGLESFDNPKLGSYGRLLVEKIEDITVINDTYNANPESMEQAINAVMSLPVKIKRYCVLADMLELGQVSIYEHLELLRSLCETPLEVMLFGDEMKKAYMNLTSRNNISHYSNKQELIDELLENIHPGDAILVKGSRGMKMEEIVDAIKNKFTDK